MSGTLDPLKPKEAQTVALTTPAAVSEDEDDGGIFHPALGTVIQVMHRLYPETSDGLIVI